MTNQKFLDQNGLAYYHTLLQNQLLSNYQPKITSTDKLSADLLTDGTNNKVFTAEDKTKLDSVLTSYTETDPTVPAWAKASTKPTYTLDEVADGSTRKLSTLAPKASPALTGTPTAPTAAVDTNTTQIATTAFVNTAIDNAIGNITQITYSVVQTLPETGQAGVIYLKANSAGGTDDAYDEYIWLTSSSSYELVGHKIMDLSNYWNGTNLTAMTNAEIDAAIA